MKAGLERFVRRFIQPIDKNLKDQLYVFGICVGIAVFFWLLIKLSKEHTTRVSIPIVFENIPQDKMLINNPDSHVYIDLNATGSELVGLKLFKRRPEVILDIANQVFSRTGSVSRVALPTDVLLTPKILNSEFSERMVGIYPDTVVLEFEDLLSKKIPVRLDVNLQLSKQHFLTDAIFVGPDSIIVSGKKSVLDQIREVKTEHLDLTNVSKEIIKETELIIPEEFSDLKFSETKVMVDIPVKKFTEIDQALNVELSNVPEGYSMKIFPEEINIIYRVAIDDYDQINESDFKVLVDFKEISANKQRTINIKMIDSPEEVDIISINPSQVEYILVKEDD